MDKVELYKVFLSILEVHNYSAVPSGSVIKIIPEANARQRPLPISTNQPSKEGDELITQLVQLNHVPATQLVPILRPLIPQSGHLAAYVPTNTLILADRASNVRRILRIIREVDQPGK